MSQRFDTRPILIRRVATATLHGTVALDWRAQLGHGAHLFCVIAGAVVARNVANQEVLDAVGPTYLGALYATAALLSGFLLATVGWLSRGQQPRTITRAAHLVVALAMVAAALPTQRSNLVALLTYVVMEASAAGLLFVFGLMLGSRFAPREARRTAARVGAGGILGGLAGGAVLSLGATFVGSRWLYCVAAALVVLPLFWITRVGKRPLSTRPDNYHRKTEVPSLRPYGRWVAISTFIMVATTTFIDYQFRFTAKQWYAADQLTAFFGFVVLTAGLVTILFQLTLLDRLLDRLGLFATATVMPAALVVTAGAFGLAPSLATLVLLKLVDSGANMSVQQATGGLLLAPLGARARSVWQSRIDGLAKRGGQALTGLFLAFFPWEPTRLLPLTLALCSLWLLALAVTRTRYVRFLTDLLREPVGEEPLLRAYDGDTVRLLEAELQGASLARTAVILELLAEAGHRASDAVLQYAGDGTAPAADLVIDYLAKLGDQDAVSRYVRDSDHHIAARALLALAGLDLALSQRYARRVVLASANAEPLRALAAALLCAQDEQAQEQAQELARSIRSESRLALATGLGALPAGAPVAVARLLNLLAADLDPEVACAALAVLPRQPSSEGTEVAIAALARRATRSEAMRALAGIGAPARARLADELSREASNSQVATAVIWVLGRLTSPGSLPPLVEALSGKHAEVRLAAAMALSSLHRRHPEMVLPQPALAARYLPELGFYAAMREAGRAALSGSKASLVLRRLFKQRAQASLECVFRLLALRYDEEALRSALSAIASGERRRRQIALELLDALLEAPVRQALAQIESDAAQRRTPNAGSALRRVIELGDPFMATLATMVLSELGESPAGAGVVEMSMRVVEDILELQSVSIFSEASAEDLAELASLLTTRVLPRGSVIYREGEMADSVYVLRRGAVALSRQGQQVEQVGPGDTFGIVAVLDRNPRELTATAKNECELRVLAAEDLLQLLADRPLFMHSIFRALTFAIRSQLDRVALGKKSDVA